jgi:hypothetical protein
VEGIGKDEAMKKANENNVTKRKPLNSTQRRELNKIITAQYDSTISCLRRQKSLVDGAPSDPTRYVNVENLTSCLRENVGRCDWLPAELRSRAKKAATEIERIVAQVDKLRQPMIDRAEKAKLAVDAMCDQLITDRNARVAQVWVASVDNGHEFLEGIPTPMDFRKALTNSGIKAQLPDRVVPELPPCPTKHG